VGGTHPIPLSCERGALGAVEVIGNNFLVREGLWGWLIDDGTLNYALVESGGL
jgi:hypothetical protein